MTEIITPPSHPLCALSACAVKVNQCNSATVMVIRKRGKNKKWGVYATIKLLRHKERVMQISPDDGAPVRGRVPNLMGLLVESGSMAETVPMMVPTLAASETTILPTGVVKTGGSSTFSTTSLTIAVSLNGPCARKRGSVCLLDASIFRV